MPNQIAIFAVIFLVACSPTEQWEMHVIDNTSFGSDGTKVCDANGDGHLDIVCGWEQGNVARLYLNPYPDNDWTYVEVPAPHVEDALVMDVDGDGNQDIVTFSEGDHRRIAFHWAPDVEFYDQSHHWISEDVPCTINATQWMFGRPMDVDRKYGPDIVVAGKNDGAIVGWLEAPENPRDLEAWQLHPIAEASWVMSIEVIDINADGLDDILYSDRRGHTNGVKWLAHPGHEKNVDQTVWKEHLIGMENLNPMFLDVYLDPEFGLHELWVPNHDDDLWHFQQVDRSGLQWKVDTFPFYEGAGLIGKSAAIGDLNDDGINDLVTTYDDAEDRQGVIWSEFQEASQSWLHHHVSGLAGNKYDFAYLIDLDYDGDLDILTSEENNNSSTNPGLGVVWYENPHK